jgi:hypothetical protein
MAAGRWSNRIVPGPALRQLSATMSATWGRVPRQLRMPLLVYVVTQVGFLFWWVALYPGLFTFDSVTYMWQVTTSNWTTTHSILYDALLWLSLQISGGVELLTLAQTTAIAAAIAYAAAGIRALGVPGRWLAVAAAVLPFLPSLGVFVVLVSKDVGFVLSQIMLLGTLARVIVVRRRTPAGSWLRDRAMRRLLWLLFAEFLGLALFRQNGFLVVLVAAVVAAVALVGLRRWLMLAGIAAIASSILLNLVIFPAIGVKQAGSELLLGPAYADLAVMYHDRPGSFTAKDKELMSRVAPLSVWRANATCWTSDPTTNTLDLKAAAANSSALFDLWVRAVKRDPDKFIDTRMCRGSIAWSIETGPNNAGTLRIPINGTSALNGWKARLAPDNPYRSSIKTAPLSRTAYQLAIFLRKASGSLTLTPILWRGALWCYILYMAILLFARRRAEWSVLALVSVAVANQLVVMTNNPGQLTRYMIGPIFAGILLLPLAFAGLRTGRPGTLEEAQTAAAVDGGHPAPAVDGGHPAPAVDGGHPAPAVDGGHPAPAVDGGQAAPAASAGVIAVPDVATPPGAAKTPRTPAEAPR